MKPTNNLLQKFCKLRLNFNKSQNDFNTFFHEYYEAYSKMDKRVMKQAYDKYTKFISSLPVNIQSTNPTPLTVSRFVDYLSSTSKGDGAASTYSRFKKAVAYAVKTGILKENPCSGIRCPSSDDSLVKDILSEEEIRTLLQTHVRNGNEQIRKAFIFSLYTGLRFCDIIQLKYSDFDLLNKMLTFRQSKTRRQAHIPLREDLLLTIFGRNKETGTDSLVFKLPSHPTCMKELRRWTAAAGINKHITWHCARHTFATNILKNGADVRVTASLLGHRSLRYVERYTRVIDQSKMQAINSLPPLF